jgi:hypothetical protein
MNSPIGKTIIVALAIVGALALLGALGMFFMHSTMMGGANSHGMWSSMTGMCRGMMGS